MKFLTENKEVKNNVLLFVLSVVLHPIFLPFYLMLWYLYSNVNVGPMLYSVFIPSDVKVKWLILNSFFAIVLPLIIMFLLNAFKLIRAITLDFVADRKYFFLFMSIYYGFVFYILKDFYFKDLLKPTVVIFVVMSVLTFLSFVFTTSTFKISVHSAGYGALTGFFVAIAFIFHGFFLYQVMLVVLISAIVMMIRIAARAHNFIETLVGWTMGLLSCISIYFIAYRYF